jgi:FKBP12-rapamycin complex-associated protein
MMKMREHSGDIVDQARMVSTELIRAAILWHEMWYDGLEEASKYYFADGNIPGMFEVLEPLHEMVENVSPLFAPNRSYADIQGPETLRETSFVQSFGHDLRIAREHLAKYTLHNDNTEIQQAWDIYYAVSYREHIQCRSAQADIQVFQRLGKQLKLLTVIELQYVSPRLMNVRDLVIAVPGTYQSGKPIIGIQQVLPTFNVITSKQRPRKFSLKGTDGKEYTYCLKGTSVSSNLADKQDTKICDRTNESCNSSDWSTLYLRPIRRQPRGT